MGGLVKEVILGYFFLRLFLFSHVIIIVSMLQYSVHSAYFSAKYTKSDEGFHLRLQKSKKNNMVYE